MLLASFDLRLLNREILLKIFRKLYMFGIKTQNLLLKIYGNLSSLSVVSLPSLYLKLAESFFSPFPLPLVLFLAMQGCPTIIWVTNHWRCHQFRQEPPWFVLKQPPNEAAYHRLACNQLTSTIWIRLLHAIFSHLRPPSISTLAPTISLLSQQP